jgi:hypothetical protein
MSFLKLFLASRTWIVLNPLTACAWKLIHKVSADSVIRKYGKLDPQI